MNRYDRELERLIVDEDRPSRAKKPARRRKLWIPVTGVVVALLVAAISVISVSAGSVDEAASENVTLKLAEQDAADGSGTELMGFVLTDVSDMVDDVLPSVVSITSRSLVNYYGNSGFFGNGGMGNMGNMDDFWNFFFGDSFGGRGGNGYYYEVPAVPETPEGEEGQEEGTEEEPQEIESGMGSGTIVGQNSSELLILTSYHVVSGCSSLYVTFVNDANVDGYIKAADPDKDIAIVAIPLADIDEETLNSIKIATIATEEPKVGEGCLVIGNALSYGISVTSGIVSKTDRILNVEGNEMEVIQTDAAINFGNSGGCMVNSKGEIIGIAEAKTVMDSVEGMCYAIPVVRNIDLIQDLMNEEEPFDASKLEENATVNGGFLGIRGRDVNDELSAEFEMPVGVYVSSVVPGSGAEEAGIQSGDIIVGFGDDEISTMAELQYDLSSYEAGDTVKLTINRLVDGAYETQEIEVTLTDRIS